MNENPIPDFIKNNNDNYNEKIGMNEPINNSIDNPIPDFIKNEKQDDLDFFNYGNEKISSNTQSNIQSKILDERTKQELGIDFDNSFSSNQQAVSDYVDGLSDEDYQTWLNLKNEGYSLDARKAMFDNKDNLYDITAKGNEKFYSGNKSKILDTLINIGQNFEDSVGDIYHPWNQSVQEKLGGIEQTLNETKFSDIKNVFTSDENTNRFIKPFQDMGANLIAGYVRKEEIAGSLISSLIRNASDWLEQGLNWGSKEYAEKVNSVVDMFDEKYGYNKITPNENLPSKRGSLTRMLADSVGIVWTVEQPLAAFIMTGLVNEDEKLQELMSKGFTHLKDYVDPVFDWLAEKGIVFDKMTEEERDITIGNILYGIFGLTGKGIVGGVGKMSNSRIAREFQAAYNVAKKRAEFAKIQTENELAQGVKGIMRDYPEGAQLTTEGGTPLFTNTPEGIKTTWQGNIWANTKIRGAQWETFKNYLQWIYNNKNKWLVTRNPNEPVGDLPVIPGVKVGNETPKIKDTTIKPVEETKIEAPKQEIKTTTPKTVATTKPVEKTSTIKEFIKSVKEDFESPNSGISKELSEKIQTSPALQSEYVNTIDPYIRANGATNPSGVIEQPLRDFLDTVLEELNYKRFSEVDQNRINQQTKINIPVQDKVRYETQQQEYKNLIKLLSKDYDNPEEYLKYLLNLKPETVKTLDRLIPDFSKNLGLIKDTLDLTKAITSTDLLGKLLDWKSNWGGRNKASIRNYIWRKRAEAYKNSSTKTRMAEVEQIINQMSEEELARYEQQMNDDLGIRRFDWRAEGYMPETMGEKGNISFKEAWNKKRPGTNKTIGEMYEKYKAKITLAKDESDYRLITKDMPGHESLAAYSENLDRFIFKELNNPNEQFFYHEWYHRVLNQLGTNKMLNILEYISKRDNISQEAAFERRAEYGRNYVQYNNIDGKRYILKELGEAFDPKLLQVMEKTKDELFDLFNIKDLQELEINQIISDVKHDTKAGEEIMNRKPQPILSKVFEIEDPRKQRGDVDYRRLFLKRINPEVERVRMDYDQAATNPYAIGNVVIEMKDGSTQTWEQFKRNMTKEQLEKEDVYMEEVLDDIISQTFNIEKQANEEYGFAGEGKFDYKTLQNEKKLDYSVLSKKGYEETKDTLGIESLKAMDLLTQLKQIDPDIVGLKEKNGKLMVEYLDESYWERREQADRPGQRELKTAPAYAYFSEEEKANFPKEVQDMINRDEGLYQGGEGGLQYSDGKNLKLGKGYYFGSRKQAEEFGPAIIELERNNWKLKEFKDTQEYQVEASKNGGKEEYNKKLKEEGFDGIKAYNKAFGSDEYNFFENPFKKDLVTTNK